MNYDSNDFYTSERRSEQYGEQVSLGAYTAKTFLWMFLGLLVTFGVAVGFAGSGLLWSLARSVPAFPFVLLIAELAVVLILVSKVHTLPVNAARGLFIAYAVLNGVVFSTYFIMYDLWSVVLVFAMTALYFGAMAVYGFVTKSDLSRLRPILVGGVIILLIFWGLSLFLNLSGFETVVCLIGIAVFLGFTAYDTQKIKAFHATFAHDPEMAKKASIFAALQLYLDFVNLFIYLLRILGRRRS